LKCCEVRVNPWLFRSEDIPDNNLDECITKVHTDMGGEVLDAQVNLLLVNEPQKQINREGIPIHLDANIVSESRKIQYQTYTQGNRCHHGWPGV